MSALSNFGGWKPPLLEVGLLVAFAASGMAAPDRYVLSRVVADLGADTTKRISDLVLFNEAGDVVFQVDRNEASRVVDGFFFGAADGTVSRIVPPSGYDAVATVPGLNEFGEVAGQAQTTTGTPRQTAFVWSRAGGAERAEGLDAGASDFKSINGGGLALGNTDSGTFELVTWIQPTFGAPVVTTIVPPDGATRVETISVNERGESLLIVDVGAERRMAIWDGSTSTFIGPVLPGGFNLFNANAKLNDAGDVAAVIFDPDASIYRVWLVRAEERESSETFDFPRAASNVFQVQFNRFRQVCFGTAEGRVTRVEFLDTTTGQSRSFDGYRGLLNSQGQLVYGNARRLLQWDSFQPEIEPVVVPIIDGTPKLAPDVVAFNGRGELVLRLARTVEPNGDSLEVYVAENNPPPPPTPVVVEVVPTRGAFRIGRGDRFARRVVDSKVRSGSGEIEGRIRYELNGRLPRGLRFRSNPGKIVGRPTVKGKFVVRVFAKYRVDGQLRLSPPAKVKIRVRR